MTVTSNASDSPHSISLSGTGDPATANLALGATMSASGYTQSGFPQHQRRRHQQLLGEQRQRVPAVAAGRPGFSAAGGLITLDLPPSALGHRHRDPIPVGSADGSSWTTLAGAGYTFDPAPGTP